ncbi:helix-turn-helix transcriptional regulator [Euzebya tangerina]|uniref:helix-turn-helix transcriptional regulator n=1 Tax=Euzebya tangerina TaxID=591198 RepID=UPI000E31155A|nr:WYL domain-containing protein [Euzebya tangerina]
MRIDRLLAVLLLLQRRGQVTAADVAEEMEVSERTARRDLEALMMAGVPVYSVAGRGGGWRLVGGARTDLTGLTADEARALFLVAGPAAEATPAVKAALRKLVQALPKPFRGPAETAASSLVVDPKHWGASWPAQQPPRFLEVLQEATIAGVQVQLGYNDRHGSPSRRTIHPLGVVVKGPAWYVVSNTDEGIRTFRIDRVSSVELTDEPVTRPADFDLGATWRQITEEVNRIREPLEIDGLCASDGMGKLRMTLGDRLAIGDTAEDGRIEVRIRGYNEYALAGELAGLVEWLEITAPVAVRDRLVSIGRSLVDRYSPAGLSVPS